MKLSFGGPAIFLERSDINTDEIISGQFLNEVNKDSLQPHLLEGLKLDGFDPKSETLKRARVLITRENFGCGSSREHAVWALDVNDIHTIIAQGYSRIFRQNMFNCGMLAIELPKSDIDRLFALGKEGELEITVNIDAEEILFYRESTLMGTVTFQMKPFEKCLIEAGGWVNLADVRY